MLKGIFKFVAFLAVMLIAVESAWTLWNQIRYLKRNDDPFSSPVAVKPDAKADKGHETQFLTTLSNSINWGRYGLEEDGVKYPDWRFVLIPIAAQTRDEPAPVSSAQIMRQSVIRLGRKDRAGLPDRKCSGDSYANIVVYDRQTDQSSILFDSALAVVFLDTYAWSPVQESHAIFYIAENDSNSDGILSCKDRLSLYTYQYENAKLQKIDLENAEPMSPPGWISSNEIVLGLGYDENNDGLHDPLRERVEPVILNVVNQEITRVVDSEQFEKMEAILASSIQ